MLYKEELIKVFEEAIAVARFEAKIEARMRVALSMLESEMSYEEIEKFTGVTKDEIEYEIESNLDWDTEWDSGWRDEQDFVHRNKMDDRARKTTAEVVREATPKPAELPIVNLGLEIRLCKRRRRQAHEISRIPFRSV